MCIKTEAMCIPNDEILQAPDHAVHIGAVNCVLQKELCMAEGIKSYPTVKRFDGAGQFDSEISIFQ